MNRPILFDIPKTSSFAEAEEVLKSRDLVQGDALEGGRVPHLPDIITSIDGPRHMARRRMYTALFRPVQLAFYEHDILRDDLRAGLDAAIAGTTPGAAARLPDLPLIIRAAVVKVSARLIGLDLADDAAVSELVRHSRNIAEGRDQVWAMAPDAGAIARARQTWEEFLRDFHRPSRARREALLARLAAGEIAEEDLPKDLITLLLREGGPDILQDDMMAYEVGLFLTASVNTTAAAAPKAAEALALWLQDNPGDRGRLKEESFLRLAAQEALRLYPTVPFLVREAARDTVLSTGRALKQGELIRADIAGANRDPLAFGAAPDTFNPFREIRATRLFGLSFGAGPHLCMGREMVTGRPGGAADGAVGLVICVLDELYRRGLALDPDNPPQVAGGTSQHKYVSFPAILTHPEGARDD